MSKMLISGAVLWLGCAKPDAAPVEPVQNSAVTEAEVQALVRPEPAAAAADYHAEAPQLRLFGTQAVGTEAASATIADTRDWQTRTVRVGEHLARNLTVAAIHENSVELTSGTSRLSLQRGEDTSVRLVHHRIDDSAQYVGKHRWQVRPDALNEVSKRHGVGATAESSSLFGIDGVRVREVAPGSAFDRLGFEAGDFIAEVDGKTAQPDQLDEFVTSLTSPGEVTVRVIRNGKPESRTYASR